MKKIPPDAFDFYFSLGPPRSYQAVADKYGVTKRAVTVLAKRENWQTRLTEVEQKAQARTDEKKVDALEAAHEQRLKALRLVLGKGIEGLRDMPIDSPRDAIRAIGLAVREIRVELGEPSDRTAPRVEANRASLLRSWLYLLVDVRPLTIRGIDIYRLEATRLQYFMDREGVLVRPAVVPASIEARHIQIPAITSDLDRSPGKALEYGDVGVFQLGLTAVGGIARSHNDYYARQLLRRADD